MRASRRQFFVGGITLAAVTACGSPQPTLVDPAEPLPPFEDRVTALETRHNAYAGLYAVDVDTGRSVSHRADDPFAMCSTFKTYAASRVLQKSAAGELKLNDAVSISPEDIVANSPVTGAHVDQSMTIGELCQAALQQSDNAAGNWLLRIIGGPSRITDFARSIGDERTRLERWETELNTAIPGDPRDTSTPRALGEGYRKLLTGDALGAVERTQLEDWMRGNATSSMRAGLLPRWTSADKTGSGDYGSTNDVGVAYSPNGQRALLSFMTRSQTDDPKAQGLRPLIGELTTLVLPYLTGQM
ncbi:MAG: beta-lactamase class [Mycobacterium sp.]|jgi:beta-lactamase class A|nr:beta-lactamase class [Mycobacterium sp.]